jgi:lysosome membrane protein 2
VLVPPVLENVLEQQVLEQQRWILSNTSGGYAQWQSSSFPGALPEYLYVYAFNITNPMDVINGEKPKLQQLGPYVYTWNWYLFEVNWFNETQFVEFFKREYYVYSQELTGKNLNAYTDICNFPSLAYAGLRAQLGNPGDDLWWQALAVDIVQAVGTTQTKITNNMGPFINASVHDYVWGFESDLLLWVNATFGQFLPTKINPVVSVQNNDTDEATSKQRHKYQKDVFHTGKPDSQNLNQYYKFQGQTDLGIWGSADANQVRGTDGLGFTINMKNYPPVEIFVDNILRHIRFVSNQTLDIKGITTDVYFIDQDEFSNKHTEYYLNAPSGVANITAVNIVNQGAAVPIVVSQPHYFMADPYYINQIEFLPPNNVTELLKHNTFLFVEPHTGITISANKRLQVNLQVKPTLLMYPNLAESFIPVIWFEQYALISDEKATEWKNSVGEVVYIMSIVPIIFFTFAGVCLFSAGFVFLQAYVITRPPDGYGYHPINE